MATDPRNFNWKKFSHHTYTSIGDVEVPLELAEMVLASEDPNAMITEALLWYVWSKQRNMNPLTPDPRQGPTPDHDPLPGDTPAAPGPVPSRLYQDFDDPPE